MSTPDGGYKSYRIELGGELGVFIIMDIIQLHIMEPSFKYHITVICDGLSALNTVGTEAAYIKSFGKNVDLISVTSDIWLK